ncbi:hypothetical protein [Morganella morganii]|uniref:Uncharacterized protein n=1 Tax=Morganella morganii TaxID=582 RepID=A0AAE4JUC1_MORMO|nr:hypothetical protein [Morganella morganii]SGD84840.1 Uncharacterised protein [Mycobacterium tuberculosis]AMG70895.1 hypothetical protein AL531_11335 [Morganella morganii]EKL3980266.1 hypothetical protein [Morganella morganii]EKU4004112.1 hypothetical protein [Morganella morganii]EKU4288252.1 hypothetical protein [Morganella morganii]
MNMRSESKEIYGVSVFPALAVQHQIRRWWVLRDIRKDWHLRNLAIKCLRGRPDIADFFNIRDEYTLIRHKVKHYLREGVI